MHLHLLSPVLADRIFNAPHIHLMNVQQQTVCTTMKTTCQHWTCCMCACFIHIQCATLLTLGSRVLSSLNSRAAICSVFFLSLFFCVIQMVFLGSVSVHCRFTLTCKMKMIHLPEAVQEFASSCV